MLSKKELLFSKLLLSFKTVSGIYFKVSLIIFVIELYLIYIYVLISQTLTVSFSIHSTLPAPSNKLILAIINNDVKTKLCSSLQPVIGSIIRANHNILGKAKPDISTTSKRMFWQYYQSSHWLRTSPLSGSKLERGAETGLIIMFLTNGLLIAIF
jgi:hypothetical protein